MIRNFGMRARQGGAILIISLLLLVAMTIVALTSMEDSSLSLRIVGNMQFRKSAELAAQAAIERVLATPAAFESRTPDTRTETLQGWSVNVQPRFLGCPCGTGGAGGGSSLWASQHYGLSFGSQQACWDVVATVVDAATGTKVTVHQGVSRSQACPGS